MVMIDHKADMYITHAEIFPNSCSCYEAKLYANVKDIQKARVKLGVR